MRELRFRAWVKEVYENEEFAYGGYMIEPHQITSLLLSNVSSLMNGPRGTGIEYFEQGSFLPGHGSLDRMKFDEIQLMQYTGLKDKNGVEIYEKDEISDNLGIGTIEYSTKKAAFLVDYKDGSRKWFVDYTDEEMKSIKRLGNIYETQKEPIA